MRLPVAFVLVLLAAAPALAQGENQFVAATLAAIKPGDDTSVAKAENALAAKGQAILPALKDALAEKRRALEGMETARPAPGEAPALRQQVDALDSAIIRLTLELKFDPRAHIREWVAVETPKGQPVPQYPRPARIMDDDVARTFPHELFYVVRFRMYPVARAVPAPFKPITMLAVNEGGAVQRITSPKVLERFAVIVSAEDEIRDARGPVVDAASAKAAVRAWLRLSEEFSQDGMLRFQIPADSLTAKRLDDDGWEASGKAVVVPDGGNGGEISATITFDPAGTFVKVQEERSVKPGMRPI